MSHELTADQLRRVYIPGDLSCQTSGDVEPVEGIIGQERAVKALKFGLDIQSEGFNVYVAGPPGIGKMTAVRRFLEDLARKKDRPPDWCYVNNFEEPYQPQVLELPSGLGRQLRQDMQTLIEHIRREIPRTFESDEYGAERERVTSELASKREALLGELSEKAGQSGFGLQATQLGVMLIPVKDGQPLKEGEVQALPEEERQQLIAHRDELQRELVSTMKQLRQLERQVQARLEELDKGVADYLVGGVVTDLGEKYHDVPDVVGYLKGVQADILENVATFKEEQAEPRSAPAEDGPKKVNEHRLKELSVRKYEVNVLVDNGKLEGAPVVVELNPNYANLFGRIEKEPQFGALYTDMTMIQPGSLQRANGGFLVLPADDILKDPLSWEALKRALRARRVEIEEISERMGFVATKSLRPQAIPLDVKVVLVGKTLYYYLLHSNDEEFPEVFKVKADFDTRMDASADNVDASVRFVCRICTKEGLRHIDAGGLARLLEHSARLADHKEKLSTHFGRIADLVREANFWAGEAEADLIGAEHVKRALDEKIFRSNLYETRSRELVGDGTILIDTTSSVVGQVNGLSVLMLGDYRFGKPARITASVGPGKRGLVDIEREVKLGGALHSKGVLILGGYLSHEFATRRALSLEARLVFEQSYEGVDGDSASSTELYALLSALSGVPIKQGIAVTGSVNQRGEVQAIGGVNNKIEGFFDVCKLQGLTGEQGAMIPASNVRNLMLREDVVEAVREGKFHVWQVKSIDEGIEILTGVPAGTRGEDGSFPAGTIKALVDKRLAELSESLKEKSVKDEAES